MKPTTPKAMPTEQLINELQSCGVRLVDPKAGHESRRGGAGPSDHKAMTIDGMTVMVPVHTAPAFESPYVVEKPDAFGRSTISRDGVVLGSVSFPARPRFYDRSTADGIPYWKIAVLHSRDVLATTVLQSCIRYQSRTKTCQFCAIGQSLAAGRTIERKTPAQLAEVAKAAVELDGVKHMVMTTGTPPGRDRGAAILAESASAVKAAVDLPIQGQCEPPDEDIWFERMRDAGIDALGMHLEAVTAGRARADHAGQGAGPARALFRSLCRGGRRCSDAAKCRPTFLPVSATRKEAILATCEKLIALGVYPFVVPFVPISGHAAGKPSAADRRPSCTRFFGPLAQHAARRRTASNRHQGRLRQMRRLLGAVDLRAGGRGMIFEPFPAFLPSEYRVKFATERVGAPRSRRAAAPGILRRAGHLRGRRPRRHRRRGDPDRRHLLVRASPRRKSSARSASTRRSRAFGGARGSRSPPTIAGSGRSALR